MRITTNQLRRIIKEEVSKALGESELQDRQLDMFDGNKPDYLSYMESVALGDFMGIKNIGKAELARDLANWNDKDALDAAMHGSTYFDDDPATLVKTTKLILQKLSK